MDPTIGTGQLPKQKTGRVLRVCWPIRKLKIGFKVFDDRLGFVDRPESQ